MHCAKCVQHSWKKTAGWNQSEFEIDWAKMDPHGKLYAGKVMVHGPFMKQFTVPPKGSFSQGDAYRVVSQWQVRSPFRRRTMLHSEAFGLRNEQQFQPFSTLKMKTFDMTEHYSVQGSRSFDHGYALPSATLGTMTDNFSAKMAVAEISCGHPYSASDLAGEQKKYYRDTPAPAGQTIFYTHCIAIISIRPNPVINGSPCEIKLWKQFGTDNTLHLFFCHEVIRLGFGTTYKLKSSALIVNEQQELKFRLELPSLFYSMISEIHHYDSDFELGDFPIRTPECMHTLAGFLGGISLCFYEKQGREVSVDNPIETKINLILWETDDAHVPGERGRYGGLQTMYCSNSACIKHMQLRSSFFYPGFLSSLVLGKSTMSVRRDDHENYCGHCSTITKVHTFDPLTSANHTETSVAHLPMWLDDAKKPVLHRMVLADEVDESDYLQLKVPA